MFLGTKGSSSLLVQQDSHVVRGASYERIRRILDTRHSRAGRLHAQREARPANCPFLRRSERKSLTTTIHPSIHIHPQLWMIVSNKPTPNVSYCSKGLCVYTSHQAVRAYFLFSS
jgi:hypothetical protein